MTSGFAGPCTEAFSAKGTTPGVSLLTIPRLRGGSVGVGRSSPLESTAGVMQHGHCPQLRPRFGVKGGRGGSRRKVPRGDRGGLGPRPTTLGVRGDGEGAQVLITSGRADEFVDVHGENVSKTKGDTGPVGSAGDVAGSCPGSSGGSGAGGEEPAGRVRSHRRAGDRVTGARARSSGGPGHFHRGW